MAKVLKPYRIANPGKRKGIAYPVGRISKGLHWARRKAASPKQLAARAKFTAMVRAKNAGKVKRAQRRARTNKRAGESTARGYAKRTYKAKSSIARGRYEKAPYYQELVGNPGEIITIGMNPGRINRKLTEGSLAGYAHYMSKKRKALKSGKRSKLINMARRKRRVGVRRRRVSNPQRHRVSLRRNTRRRNPVARRQHTRRRNPIRITRRRYMRRRNPDFGGLKTTGMTVLGLIGGAAITKMVTDKLPSNLSTGFMRYLTLGAVATIMGYGVGKFAKNPSLGSSLALGGYVVLGLQLLTDYLPGFAGYVPFGLKGMGLIAPSNFYVPQVNMPGTMSSFVAPPALAAAAAPVARPGLKGIGTATRLSRVS